jgi:DNA-binding NtrC family response regulator
MTLQSILVVEDEAIIRLDVETGLSEAGFEVVGAPNVTTALKFFNSDAVKFMALVTDVRLGVGDSGWDLARHIRKVTPGLPVIYMSGDSTPDWHAQGVPDSIMIQKPFVMAQIITALSTLLNNVPPSSGSTNS